jgi:sialidase-1
VPGRFLIVAAFCCGIAFSATPVLVDLYRAGEGGYSAYRIPAMVMTSKGTLLAFCEGRKNSASDSGNIDIVLRRSFDNGRTWSPAHVVADRGENTIGNPAPVVERKTGTIFLLLTSNPGAATERQITDGVAPAGRTVWIAHSTDDGASWTAPVEITEQVKRPDWTWYATGPGNGIQLRSGRLVVPCDHVRRDGNERHSHVIYSDDRGETWRIGGIAEDKTNESAVAELRDGSLLLNMRSYHGRNRRAVQRSRDGGLSWSALQFDEALIEPVCEASLISIGKRLLFSNPAATTRTRMTVRLSDDDGRTWTASRLLYEGPSAYSSLAALRDGRIGLLFEYGDTSPYERIAFTRFELAWMKRKP